MITSQSAHKELLYHYSWFSKNKKNKLKQYKTFKIIIIIFSWKK